MKNKIRLITGILTVSTGIFLLFNKEIGITGITICVGAILILLGAKNILFDIMSK